MEYCKKDAFADSQNTVLAVGPGAPGDTISAPHLQPHLPMEHPQFIGCCLVLLMCLKKVGADNLKLNKHERLGGRTR